MSTGIRMTIQDYFRRAGMGANSDLSRGKTTRSNSGGDSFTDVLNGVQPHPPSDPPAPSQGGLRISDYWKRPVPARSPFRNALSHEANKESTPADFKVAPMASRTPPPIAPLDTLDPAVLSIDGQGNRPERSSTDSRISESIQAAADKYNLPAGLIRSVIRAESNFQPDAVSRAGAQGLMQLMPATARELGVDDAFDIEQNIDGGARYLRQMMDMFGGNLKRALAAYNAGPGTVRRYNGNVPYRETRNYVSKVLAFSKQYAV